MCAAWKKKNERKEIVCFYSTQSDILLCGIAMFSRGNKNKLRTFQPQTKFTGSYKKKSVCDLIFIFILIFIMINCVMSWIQTHLFFCLFFLNMSYYFWMKTCMKNVNNFQMARVQLSICLIFCQFQPTVTVIKVLLIEKACT